MKRRSGEYHLIDPKEGSVRAVIPTRGSLDSYRKGALAWVEGASFHPDSRRKVSLAEIAQIDEAFGSYYVAGLSQSWFVKVKPRDGYVRLDVVDWINTQTGRIAVTTMGHNYNLRANARMRLWDGRWVRLAVKRLGRNRAIMSALTADGSPLVLFRKRQRAMFAVPPVEAFVLPGQPITNELALMTALCGHEFDQYFHRPGGG